MNFSFFFRGGGEGGRGRGARVSEFFYKGSKSKKKIGGGGGVRGWRGGGASVSEFF